VNKFLLQRLRQRKILKRILRERMTEPIHLNIAAVGVQLFGSFRTKVDFDLILRPQHAFGLLKAADWAKEQRLSRITAMEFGVANGLGLLNICEVARKVTAETGVRFDIVGFDSGQGMPPARDYRDHPEIYSLGDFPMQNPEALRSLLPGNARLILGKIRETVAAFRPESPIGFISVDVDYYFSAVDALQILAAPPESYLPSVVVYLDDVDVDTHNEFCGELLAAREFVDTHPLRPITRFNMLRSKRLFQRALWIDHMFLAHVLDHPLRQKALTTRLRDTDVLDNPYLTDALSSRSGKA
jgi:hypothetical protein